MSLSKRALEYILDWHTDNEEDDDAIPAHDERAAAGCNMVTKAADLP